jgi:hypothetical protein
LDAEQKTLTTDKHGQGRWTDQAKSYLATDQTDGHGLFQALAARFSEGDESLGVA